MAQDTLQANDQNQPIVKRGYIYARNAWWYTANFANRTDGIIDDVYFGRLDEDGHLCGETVIEWLTKPFNEPTACFHAFHDCWPDFASVVDVLGAMAALGGQNITPDQFCALLDTLGFVDVTPTQSPYAEVR